VVKTGFQESEGSHRFAWVVRGARMKDLIEYIAKRLVDNPDEVFVKETRGTNVTMLELRVDQKDMGRVIGKEGRVANAMRVLLRVAAGDRRVTLDIE
jgi:uncharacterized protein